MYKKDVSQLIMLSILWLWKLRMGNGVREFVVPGGGKLLYRALHHLTPPPLVMMTMVSIVETVMLIKIGLYWAVLGCSGLHWTDKNWVFGGGEKGEGEGINKVWSVHNGSNKYQWRWWCFDDIGGWPVIEMPIFQARLFHQWRFSFAR